MTKVQTLFTRFKGNNTTLSGVSWDGPSQMNLSQYSDQDQIRIRGGSHCPHTARPAKTFAALPSKYSHHPRLFSFLSAGTSDTARSTKAQASHHFRLDRRVHICDPYDWAVYTFHP